MLKRLILVLMILFFAGCIKKDPYLPTVKKVDIQKYKGTWYEIARFEHFFEKGCKNVTATYELKENGDIKVINSCQMIEDDSKKEATGIARVVDKTTNSKLEVSFFRPFWGDYWIIDIYGDYETALVGTPSREYLWILSRSKTIDKNLKEKIVKKLPSLGFDPKKFVWTIQE